MSAAVWVVIVGFVVFVAGVAQFGMYRAYQHKLTEAYHDGYRKGLGEAWKGQPDPKGRHQGANDVTRLVTKEEAWPLLMAATLRPELERLYPGEGK